MRVNQFVAHATGLSRRAADTAVARRRVTINGLPAELGSTITEGDEVRFDDKVLVLPSQHSTIMLYKPVGYVTSRRQQGQDPTIYELLPQDLHRLKPVGRLDRDSSGLLLLTSDGHLAQRLQHPSQGKWKHYEVTLDRPLSPQDQEQLEKGVKLKDGLSKLVIRRHQKHLDVRLQEGRNRQIRRSFGALGYTVVKLHRTTFGSLKLGRLRPGAWQTISPEALT